MVKFNVSILNRLNILNRLEFLVNSKYIHKSNAISNKTVTKPVNGLTKCFFPYLNPTDCLSKF